MKNYNSNEHTAVIQKANPINKVLTSFITQFCNQISHLYMHITIKLHLLFIILVSLLLFIFCSDLFASSNAQFLFWSAFCHCFISSQYGICPFSDNLIGPTRGLCLKVVFYSPILGKESSPITSGKFREVQRKLWHLSQPTAFIPIYIPFFSCLQIFQYKTQQRKNYMRKLKWAQNEEQQLRILRDQKKIKSWKTIAFQMNSRFPDNLKSPKQCREKYINYTRFYLDNGIQQETTWSLDDDLILFNLYSQHGSKWSSFTNILTTKSQNSIKNRFYNKLKKLSKRFDQHRQHHSQQSRYSSSYQSLIRILDFTNQAKTVCQGKGLRINNQCLLFEVRKQILNLCFKCEKEQVSCQQLCSANKKIKEINIKIRCFGICKAKNRKNWKLTQKGLQSSLQQGLNMLSLNSDQQINPLQMKEDQAQSILRKQPADKNEFNQIFTKHPNFDNQRNRIGFKPYRKCQSMHSNAPVIESETYKQVLSEVGGIFSFQTPNIGEGNNLITEQKTPLMKEQYSHFLTSFPLIYCPYGVFFPNSMNEIQKSNFGLETFVKVQEVENKSFASAQHFTKEKHQQ